MTQTFDLSTLDWTLRGWHPWFWCNQISMETGIGLHGDVGPVPARVPGSVQQALREAGLLPDWNVGLNSRVCEWVEHRHWSYETLLPDSLVQNPGRKVLHLEGLDVNGILFVNGKRVLEFANAFLDHSVDITDYLLTQGNKLCLVLKQAYCDPDVLTELRDRTSDNAPLRRQMPSRAVGQVVIGNVFLFGVKGGGGSGHPDPDIKW